MQFLETGSRVLKLNNLSHPKKDGGAHLHFLRKETRLCQICYHRPLWDHHRTDSLIPRVVLSTIQ